MFGGVVRHDAVDLEMSGQAHGADSSGTAVPAVIVQQAEAVTALGETGVAVAVAAAGMVQPDGLEEWCRATAGAYTLWCASAGRRLLFCC